MALPARSSVRGSTKPTPIRGDVTLDSGRSKPTPTRSYRPDPGEARERDKGALRAERTKVPLHATRQAGRRRLTVPRRTGDHRGLAFWRSCPRRQRGTGRDASTCRTRLTYGQIGGCVQAVTTRHRARSEGRT
jgi:hypothetical protein